MKDGDGHDVIRLNRKVDGVGESVEQRASYLFFNDWEPKRIVCYVFECRAKLISEANTQTDKLLSYHNAASLMSTCASGRTEMLRFIGYLAYPIPR
jgi:hypothetical protein